MTWFTAASLTIASSASVASVVSGEDITNIQAGDALIVGLFLPVEIKRAYIDGSNNKLIELVTAWPNATQTAVAARSIPTAGDFTSAVTALRQATTVTADNFQVLDDWGTVVGTVDFINQAGATKTARTLQQMDDDVAAVEATANGYVGNMLAMSKAEFFALAEQRIRDSAGSGFAEWGKHRNYSPNQLPVNEGISSIHTVANTLRIGYLPTTQVEGVSRTNNPIVLVNGVNLSVLNINYANNLNNINFPDAPDGLDKNDGTRYASLAAAITDGGTSLVNSVLSRQDFVFLESWHEKITDKDVVYPLGNVQYGATTWEGIALSNTVEVQGYSAFGEWDTVTKGYGVAWAALSDTNKAAFIQDKENNIYADEGELIQVRYRVRVVKGLGDEWVTPSPVGSEAYLQYSNAATGFVQVQGLETISPANTSGAQYVHSAALVTTDGEPKKTGLFSSRLSGTNASKSHDGRCYALPIALVQRRNTGVGSPLNPQGTSIVRRSDGSKFKWYAMASAARPLNVSDCFDTVSYYNDGTYDYAKWITGGSIAALSTGTSRYQGDDKFYDAIYASDVQDLRMSSKRLPLNEIREKYKRMAIAGEVRGFEAVPFTYTLTQVGTAISTINQDYTLGTLHKSAAVGDKIWALEGAVWEEYTVVLVSFNSGGLDKLQLDRSHTRIVNGLQLHAVKQTHKQAKPTWTDIIGDPANIAATFPDGVEGQWIPVIPDGTSRTFPCNRKFISAATVNNVISTTDNGVTWTGFKWSAFTGSSSMTTNTFGVNIALPAADVYLLSYETQAHFTADDVNSEVLSLGGVYATQENKVIQGNILSSGLIGKINISDLSSGVGKDSSDSGLIKYQQDYASGVLYSANTYQVLHDAINLGATTSSAVKTLDYLSSINSIAKLCYAYKEMVFDVDWGDNNLFEIIDNQDVLTDDNGNIIKYGSSSFNTQYFVVPE